MCRILPLLFSKLHIGCRESAIIKYPSINKTL